MLVPGSVLVPEDARATSQVELADCVVRTDDAEAQMPGFACDYVVDDPRLHVSHAFSSATETLYTRVSFTDETRGPPGRVHGGCLGTVLETTLTCCAAQIFGARTAITEELEVHFRDGVPIDRPAWCRTWCTENVGPVFLFSAQVLVDGAVCIEATARLRRVELPDRDTDLPVLRDDTPRGEPDDAELAAGYPLEFVGRHGWPAGSVAAHLERRLTRWVIEDDFAANMPWDSHTNAAVSKQVPWDCASRGRPKACCGSLFSRM